MINMLGGSTTTQYTMFPRNSTNTMWTNASRIQLRISWSVFAEASFVEARELSIFCKRFSFPSFLAFLNGDDAERSFLIDS